MESAVIDLNEKLINAGARKRTNIFGERGEIKFDTFHRHLISLLCIRDSLSNLNQFIYQAIIKDRIVVINDNDVIDFTLSWTDSGRGLAIKYLKSNIELFRIKLSDLIYLNLENYDIDNQLCRIERLEFGGEFGDTSDIEVRTIDENLNAYGKLIRKLIMNDEEKS